MIALLLPHTGVHAVQHAPLLACLPPFFRRALRMPWRKPAVPADDHTAGTATPPDGLRVLGDRMLSEVRAEYDGLSDAEIAALRPRRRLPRADGDIIIDQQERVHVRPVNGRLLGDLPRRKPMVNRQPWQTAEMPVYGQTCVANVQADEQAERLAS